MMALIIVLFALCPMERDGYQPLFQLEFANSQSWFQVATDFYTNLQYRIKVWGTWYDNISQYRSRYCRYDRNCRPILLILILNMIGWCRDRYRDFRKLITSLPLLFYPSTTWPLTYK